MTETTARPPEPGEMAPDFTLSSTAPSATSASSTVGKLVTLSELRGKHNVLLAFFPLAFTSTCTAEVCAFSEDFDQFAGRDVLVLPISVDSVPSLREYKKAYSLKVELLSDFKRMASRAYGVLREDTFYSNRAYFLIDKAGVVRWVHIEDKPGQLRANAEIMQHIDELANSAP